MGESAEKKISSKPLTAFGIVFGLLLCIASFVAAKILFKKEFDQYLDWWFIIFVLGVVFMPTALLIFRRFADLGWMFAKTLGIAFSGWLMWYLSSLHILKFTRTSCAIAVGICLIVNVLIFIFCDKDKEIKVTGSNISHILLAEGIFSVLFVMWLFLKSFNPNAHGTTEKLMDYGFMVAMFKSDYMPPEDMWLAGKPINYYYIGQFYATYLSKLCGCGVEYGYNLMLMMISAMGFSLPASIVYNVSVDALEDSDKAGSGVHRIFPAVAAVMSGIAVSFVSNAHYIVYAKLIPWIRTMLGLDKMASEVGYTFPNYWFPNATRYIGYNPETNDKTIYEFPLYSFVLGDLHAHVINIIFVLTVVAILYAYLRHRKHKMDAARLLGSFEDEGEKMMFGIPNFFREVLNPCVILVGFFVGLFHTTNFWDYPIYFVVAGAVILFSNCYLYNFSFKTVKLTFFHAVVVIVVEKITCLPFTISFNQISSSIRLTVNRTPLYQLLILWGIPVVSLIVFLVYLIKNQISDGVFAEESTAHTGKGIALFRFLGNLEISDLFIVTIGLCAFGLVLIPEVIYVVDIYSGDYKRANTMFKLAYQAFILFGMMMGYVIPKLVFFAKKKGHFVFGLIAGLLLLMNVGYFANSTSAWFGDWTDLERTRYLRCDQYLLGVNKQDHYATEWINKNIEGRPVLLELNGPSYKEYCRISVRTGLPTVLGWKTHEQLWQWDGVNNVAPIITEREEDIKTIYTSTDADLVNELIDKYKIEYIYVGDIEKTDLKNELNHTLLQSLGTVVYPEGFTAADTSSKSYIIKVR